ncbi:MAG: hypothetical protein AVDCRST_MAG88-3825 [uncultured Thermomicrobiales bacterium]|uniref:DoxX family protein n=1 Tax=uncultured Thermomicrobiales bacterium TaxID=1645740 RepID=A0A6J4VU96_9BACT|nr:MAG: hypothetical protein AVDCRST_MAG88-3825 [uncultured Thermomicrobiales bacterium]
MNLSLWILQALLAAVFLATGMLHLLRPKAAFEADPNFTWTKTMSQSGIWAIGAAEVAGALGLILPGLSGMLTGLVPLAALCLGLLTARAVATHLRLKESIAPALTLSLLALMVFAGRQWVVAL